MRRYTICMLLMCAVLLTVVGVSGCSSSDGSGAKVVDESTDKSSTEDTAEDDGDAKVGTRDNPLPLGTTAQVGDWEVALTAVNANANEAIAAANTFNEAPKEGSQYVLVTFKGKYVGEDSGTFWADLSYKFYGSGGNTFDGPDSMAASPNPVSDAGETFPGAEVAGDTLFEVPIDQIEGGAIILEELLSMDDTRVFFALK